MVDGKDIFDQPVKVIIRRNDNIQNITTSQEDGQTAACLLVYFYVQEHHKMIAIDLSKQQALDADQKFNKIILLGKQSKVDIQQ